MHDKVPTEMIIIFFVDDKGETCSRSHSSKTTVGRLGVLLRA